MAKKRKEKPFNFEKELLEARKRTPEDDYSSSRTCFAAVIETKSSYLELFFKCLELISKINKTAFNSELIFGARVKIYKGNSWKQKDWRWYGRRSFEVAKSNDLIAYEFKVFDLESLTENVLTELWSITDRWEIEFYASTGKSTGDDCLSSTLAFYPHGTGIEFRTTEEAIGKLMRTQIDTEFFSQADITVYYGLAALDVTRFVMVKNT